MVTDKEQYVGKTPLSKQPKNPLGFKLKDKAIKEKHLDDGAVNTRCIEDKAVTPQKVSEDFQRNLIDPLVKALDDKYKEISDSIDQKYRNITNELYNMIKSLQVGGVALSPQFGDRTDIGITQKSITKSLGAFWEEMETITGKDYMDFKLTVAPVAAYTESAVNVTITADCREAISDFDNIKVYINNTLVAESSDIEVFTTQQQVNETSEIKAVGTILGKTITKTQTVTKEIPFYMGSGMQYQDVMIPENHKVIEGTLEGDYDVTVKNEGEYIFIIIPISRKEEFRRCKLDMNGFEIPLEESETQDFIICKTLNQYQAGEYNIDIDINS